MQQEAEAAAPNALHLLATCLNQKGIRRSTSQNIFLVLHLLTTALEQKGIL